MIAADRSVHKQSMTHPMTADDTATTAVANPVSDCGSDWPRNTKPSIGSSTSTFTDVESQAEAEAGKLTLPKGAFDPEMPQKPNWFSAPRRLAVHPDASQVRHYCRGWFVS